MHRSLGSDYTKGPFLTHVMLPEIGPLNSLWVYDGLAAKDIGPFFLRFCTMLLSALGVCDCQEIIDPQGIQRPYLWLYLRQGLMVQFLVKSSQIRTDDGRQKTE